MVKRFRLLPSALLVPESVDDSTDSVDTIERNPVLPVKEER